jgi:serine/threonine protein kinase
MGVVYLARDTRLERPVALKFLRPELVADVERRSRFLREARSAAAVTHPAIAQIYDIDEADGSLFIAMEYVDGRTVGRLIAEGEIDLISSVEIAWQIAEGLARAHEANLIHRDIKSDNIMVTRDGHAKLLDFGLAKLMDTVEEEVPEASQKAPEMDETLTRLEPRTVAGVVAGTINYMSPEQARGRSLDRRSDIFSLGVVLYEMVSGELPFKGESPPDTLHAIAYEEPSPVGALRRNLPPQIHEIITRSLRKRPEDRYPEARDLAADLKRLKHALETGTSLSIRSGRGIRGWIEWLETSLPLGTRGLYLLAGALIVSALLLFTRIEWGSLIGPAILGFFLYRIVRNRKRRMLHSFTKRAAALSGVKAISIVSDIVTVVVEKAPATTYLRLTGLIEGINAKLFFGKPLTAEIRDDLTEQEFRRWLKRPGVVYAREDILIEPGELK